MPYGVVLEVCEIGIVVAIRTSKQKRELALKPVAGDVIIIMHVLDRLNITVYSKNIAISVLPISHGFMHMVMDHVKNVTNSELQESGNIVGKEWVVWRIARRTTLVTIM